MVPSAIKMETVKSVRRLAVSQELLLELCRTRVDWDHMHLTKMLVDHAFPVLAGRRAPLVLFPEHKAIYPMNIIGGGAMKVSESSGIVLESEHKWFCQISNALRVHN